MKKVVIGMSGGVDSSVAAILLKKAGYEVVGLFMRNWDANLNNDIYGNPTLQEEICPQEKDYNDALEVCKKLDIPLHRIDFVKEYWDNVFTYFLEELKNYRTPNPDVMCNKYIKFETFRKYAEKLGADYIATGHYAKVIDNTLYKASDLSKDQSYFLAMVSKDQLQNVLFPLGDIEKKKVREIAHEYGLITADKKDSTGICFIGERNFTKFLQNYLPNMPGDIVDIETNKILGRHIGLMYYTIGQRRNLNIGTSSRIYVVGKDVTKNILYIAYGNDNKYLYSNSCLIEQVNLYDNNKITKCSAKFRYRQIDNLVSLEYLDNNQIKVYYNQGIKAVTPGQICVLYDGDKCLGGGIIKEVYQDNNKLWYL